MGLGHLLDHIQIQTELSQQPKVRNMRLIMESRMVKLSYDVCFDSAAKLI